VYRYNRYVWEAKSLDKSEKLVLLCLLDHCDERGVCWPSLSTIAEETAHTKRGVLKVLDRLRGKGVISWRILPETGGRTYRVHLEALVNLTQGEPRSPGEVNHVHREGERRSPGEANDVHRGGEPRSPGGRTSFTGEVNHVRGGGEPRSPEPTNEPTNEPTIEVSKPSTTTTVVPSSQSEPRPNPLKKLEGGASAKAKGNPSPSGEADQRDLEVSPAARDGIHMFAPAAVEVRYRPPDPHTEAGARAVRALREAGLWEKFSSLRRYTRDWTAWQEWLHGPIARHYTRLGEAAFVQAVREALEGLALRPHLSLPLAWLERQLSKATPPPPKEVKEASRTESESEEERFMRYIASVLGWDQEARNGESV